MFMNFLYVPLASSQMVCLYYIYTDHYIYIEHCIYYSTFMYLYITLARNQTFVFCYFSSLLVQFAGILLSSAVLLVTEA